jgi:hypothetical protein
VIGQQSVEESEADLGKDGANRIDGTMDESGKKLTLYTEGPSMMDPAKRTKYREVLELKDKDHKVFTSEMEVSEGKWQPIVTVTYERVK